MMAKAIFAPAIMSKVFLYPNALYKSEPIIGLKKALIAKAKEYISLIKSFNFISIASSVPVFIFNSNYNLSIISGKMGKNTKTWKIPSIGYPGTVAIKLLENPSTSDGPKKTIQTAKPIKANTNCSFLGISLKTYG
jgi:hypothetical protein